MKEMEKPTIKKLVELEKQTKDKFTKFLIAKLKKDIKKGEKEIFNQLSFERILELIKHEVNKNKLRFVEKKRYNKIAYVLEISLRKKKKVFTLNGDFTLESTSNMIQKEFNMEPMHLYEFEIGNYKYGPECDEWQEMFDELDDTKLGAAISVADLKKGGKFKFLYDFGDRILFKVEILGFEKLNNQFSKK